MTLLQTKRAYPAVEFSDFSFAYAPQARPAVSQVSLEVDRGEFVLVCGDSGSGKSTFLRAISGLVPHHYGGVAGGEARICGHDLREHDAGSLAACCGTVFQDPEAQSVMDSVRAEIAFPLENLGAGGYETDVSVNEVAALLGIEHLLGRRTDELSGGELQRVALAAALAPRPELLVLDEPTSQLDPLAADELLSALHRLCIDQGTTVVLAEHRIERALAIADRVIAFADGEVAFDGPSEAFLDAAAFDPALTHLLPPLAELFRLARLEPLPIDAKQARAALPPLPASACADEAEAKRSSAPVVLRLESVGFRYGGSTEDVLSGIDLELHAGETGVLLGVNGAGKSTLLRIAHGVYTASSGRVWRAGEVALLLQNPNDYLIHERVLQEAPLASLRAFGLEQLIEQDPRDLSGGERQRLALAIVMQQDPAVLLLDEPTRGMDTLRKRELADLLDAVAARGVAVLVATHDLEFAASFSERAVLIGDRRVLADGSARELLGAGWHFSTATARLLPGSGALTPEQGAQMLGEARQW